MKRRKKNKPVTTVPDTKQPDTKPKNALWTLLDTIGVSKPSRQNLHFGMRTLKTGLAIALTTLLYSWIGRDDKSLLLAMIAAVVAMQGTVETSLRFGIQRLIGTAIGGTLGVLFVELLRHVPLYDNRVLYAVFLACVSMLAITLCVWLNLKLAATMALVVLLATLINVEMSLSASYALNRTLDTAIGIVMSIVINLTIRPPKWGNE